MPEKGTRWKAVIEALADDPERLRAKMTPTPYPKEKVGEITLGEEVIPLPDVAHPPNFRPQTEVIGSPALAQAVDEVLRFAPELQGRVPRVQEGPTKALIQMMLDQNWSPYAFDNIANIGGIRGTEQGDVWINPLHRRMPYGMLQNAVAHELSHGAGTKDEDFGSYLVGDAYEARRKKSIKGRDINLEP